MFMITIDPPLSAGFMVIDGSLARSSGLTLIITEIVPEFIFVVF